MVVSREVEDSLRPGSNSPAQDRLLNFIRGLRLAEPSVKVLGVTRPESQADLATAFDGLVSPGWDPSSLASYIRAEHLDPVGSASQDQPGEPRRVDPPTTSSGDLPMLTLLLRGQDVLACGIDLIRARCGDPSIAFYKPDGQVAAGAVAVAWDGAIFGALSGATEPAILFGHAHWLAAWLRLRDQQTQLRLAAFTDPLTGAWNRRYFERHLNAAMEQARQRRQTVTVLLFDIDDFKVYNDAYGHDAGDEILVEAVRLMRSVIRPSDRVCRIGGDEFAVIFHDPEGPRKESSRNTVSVMEVAQRFQRQIKQHRFPKLADCAPGTLSISGGMATFPWDGTSPAELLAKADQLAMAAKRQGKNAITFGPGSLRECGQTSQPQQNS
ncbi:MAG: GGDEF domain-containing protein [Planctomycetes bacterium]|nr:GGDEF domain-containing protein [Planctomycetota bacterium]